MRKAPPAKVLVFMLSRAGCLPYGRAMLANLPPTIQLKVFTSCFSEEKHQDSDQQIPTYRNRKEFLKNSLFVLPRLLRQLQNDFYHGFLVAYFPVFHHWNLPLLLFCRRLRIRTVVTVHNGRLHPGEYSRLNQWLHNRCVQLADDLIFLTQYVEQETRHETGFRGSAHIIPHGLLTLPGLPCPARTWSPKPRVLFLGRIEPYKGVFLLIEALNTLPPGMIEYLTVAGKSRGIKLLPNPGSNVRFLDQRLTEPEMARLLCEHDILILPYQQATQSGILTLGISAALPAVITRVGGLPEQLDEEEALFVPPTAEGIREGILRLATNSDLYINIHRRLLQRRTDTGWKEAAEKLAEILSNPPLTVSDRP